MAPNTRTNNPNGRRGRDATPRSPSSTSTFKSVIIFKTSPFVRIIKPVSDIVECPESTSSADQKKQTLTFTLTSEHTEKLNDTSSKYQLRLYCTTSTFYSPGLSSSLPCPIEFPPTCGVSVNGVSLQAEFQGWKKRPGTAPPADLGRAVRTTGLNRIEMVYSNSRAEKKKFYLRVFLVEVTTVAELVAKLKKQYRGYTEIISQMSNMALDGGDEIVAGCRKIYLKCRISRKRIRTPTRSMACAHVQCFDAVSWFSRMEKRTTFLCPVCDKELNPDDLILDGYSDKILKTITEGVESVDYVIVENNGQWHTSDNRYTSQSSRPRAAPRNPQAFTLDSDGVEEVLPSFQRSPVRQPIPAPEDRPLPLRIHSPPPAYSLDTTAVAPGREFHSSNSQRSPGHHILAPDDHRQYPPQAPSRGAPAVAPRQGRDYSDDQCQCCCIC